MTRGAAKWGIQVDGANELKRALKAVGETDAPFLREALGKVAADLAGHARGGATGGIGAAISTRPVVGKGATLRAPLSIKHPGARSMEFGRQWYYQARSPMAGIGNNRGSARRAKGSVIRGSSRVRRPGQRARPFLGIVGGGGAIGATQHQAREIISTAIRNEWERLGERGG